MNFKNFIIDFIVSFMVLVAAIVFGWTMWAVVVQNQFVVVNWGASFIISGILALIFAFIKTRRRRA